MKAEKTFVGKRTASVKQNSRGLHCVVVSGADVKSPLPNMKSAVRFYGCRSGEEGKKKSLEIAEKLANAASLPKAKAKAK